LIRSEACHFEECEARVGRAKELPVDREYDLFEIYPNGSLVWRAVVTGHEPAILKLRELSATTTNEVRVMDLTTNRVVATMNAGRTQTQTDSSRPASALAKQMHLELL
jgi:hypothetical protein